MGDREKSHMVLQDSYARIIDYLRISVTDRCNLRCYYCMPSHGVKYIDHKEILSYEEILRIVRIFAELGIKKVRVTGGEPLIRRDIFFLLENIGRIEGINELALTTNGTNLSGYFEDLKRTAIKRINISIDSLNREKFKRITGFDRLEEVLSSIKQAVDKDFSIKLNVVIMRGINDDELLDFIEFSIENNVDIRFIEIMPQLYNSETASRLFLPANEILERIQREYTVTSLKQKGNSTTEDLYSVSDSNIRMGLISPVSRHFCLQCNKVRLKADGALKTCLFSKPGINLRELLHKGMKEDEIKSLIISEIKGKPQMHYLSENSSDLVMHNTGG